MVPIMRFWFLQPNKTEPTEERITSAQLLGHIDWNWNDLWMSVCTVASLLALLVLLYHVVRVGQRLFRSRRGERIKKRNLLIWQEQ